MKEKITKLVNIKVCRSCVVCIREGVLYVKIRMKDGDRGKIKVSTCVYEKGRMAEKKYN